MKQYLYTRDIKEAIEMTKLMMMMMMMMLVMMGLVIQCVIYRDWVGLPRRVETNPHPTTHTPTGDDGDDDGDDDDVKVPLLLEACRARA